MLVAVVVPDEDTTKKWAYLNGHMGSFSDLCSLDQLKNQIMAELKLTAERNKVTNISSFNTILHELQSFVEMKKY